MAVAGERNKAIELGLTHYFTGRPCPFGHISRRRTASGRCLECGRESSKLAHAKISTSRKEARESKAEKHAAYIAGLNLPFVLMSRSEANEQGITRFFTGHPCKSGHMCERMTSNKACVMCLRGFRRSSPEARAKDNARRLRMAKSTPEKRKARNKSERLRSSAKLSRTLRNRINLAVRTGARGGSSVRDLGCTMTEFKAHIESMFADGMTWKNYGIKGWHLDHITPLAAFDLSDRSQFLSARHYTNYQPLWAKDNHAKSDKVFASSSMADAWRAVVSSRKQLDMFAP